jgi:hypothetical protein
MKERIMEDYRLLDSYYENFYAEYGIKNNIVYARFKPHVKDINLKIALTVVHDRIKYLSKENSLPLFFDLNNVKSIDQKSREFFGEHKDSFSQVSLLALVFRSKLQWFLARFFFMLYRPEIKFEFFTSENTALEWINNHRIDQ